MLVHSARLFGVWCGARRNDPGRFLQRDGPRRLAGIRLREELVNIGKVVARSVTDELGRLLLSCVSAQRLERRGKSQRALKPILRLTGEGLLQKCSHGFWQPGSDGTDLREFTERNRLERGSRSLVVEKLLAREKLPGHDAHRKEVRTRIDLATTDLLRRHVGQLALHLAVGRALNAPSSFRNTKVREAGYPVHPDEDVLR